MYLEMYLETLRYLRARLSRRGLSSAIVVILLAAAGILIATIAIKFLKDAAVQVNAKGGSALNNAMNSLE